MTASSFSTGPLSGVSGAFLQLLDAQLKLGTDLLESLTGIAVPSLGGSLEKLRARSKKLTRGRCTIPPPCWMPQPLGECTSHLARCKTACIELAITNCDRTPHPVSVTVTGDAASEVTIVPASIVLAPFARARVKVCFAVPAEAKDCEQHELIVHVQGCREYYLRWNVRVGSVGLDSCHEVAIDDCPDLVHHWYDHFYCNRPCRSARTNQTHG